MGPLRNADADWDAWPVAGYLAENYRELHAADEAVIDHHSEVYAQIPPDSLDCSVEFGAGPNLYPLMLAAGASRLVHAVERSSANVEYLRGQLGEGPDPSWRPFYARARERNHTLPERLEDALARVRVTRADARRLPPARYALGSMNFVAESATEDRAEFAAICGAFIDAVRPGGVLVASFMEGMGRYVIADGPAWPGVPVDVDTVTEVFAPHTTDLRVCRIDADPGLPDWGYTGMLLLAARRR